MDTYTRGVESGIHTASTRVQTSPSHAQITFDLLGEPTPSYYIRFTERSTGSFVGYLAYGDSDTSTQLRHFTLSHDLADAPVLTVEGGDLAKMGESPFSLWVGAFRFGYIEADPMQRLKGFLVSHMWRQQSTPNCM